MPTWCFPGTVQCKGYKEEEKSQDTKLKEKCQKKKKKKLKKIIQKYLIPKDNYINTNTKIHRLSIKKRDIAIYTESCAIHTTVTQMWCFSTLMWSLVKRAKIPLSEVFSVVNIAILRRTLYTWQCTMNATQTSKHLKGHLAPRVCHVTFLDQRDIPGSLSVT